MALASSQPGISLVGKDGRCLGIKALPPSCADCLETCEPQPPGPILVCPICAVLLPKTL